MSYEPIWGAAIAWYLFLAGLGGGAYVASAFLRFRYPQARSMCRVGRIVAPIVVAIGLVLLMVDAHAGFQNPLRFALLLTNFGSVMTWGVVFLGAFTVIALVALILDLSRRDVPGWLDVVGIVAAVCVAMYTGALLGVCHTFPLWNSAILPLLFLVSALSTGIALVLGVGAVKYPHEFDEVGLLKKGHYVLPWIEIVMIACLLFITASNSEAGWLSVQSLVSGSYALWFWLGFVAIGLVAPACVETYLLFVAGKHFEDSAAGHRIACVADAGVLFGGFLLRYLIVVAALPLVMVAPML